MQNRTTTARCFMCKNYIGEMNCNAFPKGIPEEIAAGEHDHTTPYPGDNGIRFEPIDEQEADNG